MAGALPCTNRAAQSALTMSGLILLGLPSQWDVLQVGGMSAGDLKDMPPFPFPEKLFPPGTFPAGMRFSDEFNLPPQVRVS